MVVSSPVKSVVTKDGKVIGIKRANGDLEQYDFVVSSMPITQLIKGMPETPNEVNEAASKLKFRNTILVYLRVNQEDIFPDQWLYIHDPKLLHGRITNFSNWSTGIKPKDRSTSLCLEFWCFDEDEIWTKSDLELIEIAKSELISTGLVKANLIEDGYVLKIKRSYPVYERGYKKYLDIVTNYLDTIDGLVAIGRYGSFKYNNQDHSILMGLLAADAISKGEKPLLWSINTESKYQEAATSQVLENK